MRRKSFSRFAQIRGVEDVQPRIVSGEDVLAELRVRSETRAALHQAIEDVFSEESDE